MNRHNDALFDLRHPNATTATSYWHHCNKMLPSQREGDSGGNAQQQDSRVYPFVRTFPGHWVLMNEEMVVAKELADSKSFNEDIRRRSDGSTCVLDE